MINQCGITSITTIMVPSSCCQAPVICDGFGSPLLITSDCYAYKCRNRSKKAPRKRRAYLVSEQVSSYRDMSTQSEPSTGAAAETKATQTEPTKPPGNQVEVIHFFKKSSSRVRFEDTDNCASDEQAASGSDAVAFYKRVESLLSLEPYKGYKLSASSCSNNYVTKIYL